MKKVTLIRFFKLLPAAAAVLPAAVSEPVKLETGLVSGVDGSGPGIRVFTKRLSAKTH